MGDKAYAIFSLRKGNFQCNHATNKSQTIWRYGVEPQTVSVLSVTNTVVYDSLGRQVSQINGRGNTIHVEYNTLGQRVASIDALGNRTIYKYDQFGNLTSVINPLGNAIVYEYDIRGRRTYEGGATYPVRYTYDVFGNKITMMTYRDEKGERGTGNGERGDVTKWLFDEASGVMTNKVYADGKGPKYDYTPDGKLARRIWARGIVTDYTYDGWGNLTNTVYSDGTPTISLFYDSLGRQIKANDAAGITTFLYDSFGSLTNETVIGVAGTNTIIRYWDEFGRTVGYVLNGTRQTTIGYESDKGRIGTMGIPNIHSTTTTNLYNYFSWTYLPGSDLKFSLSYPNGLTASWQYDANSQLFQVCNATPTNVISQYDYTYDPAGRRVAIGRSGSAMSETRTDEYGYNIRGELISAAKNAEDAKVIEYQYAYDDIGNRISSYDIGTNHIYTANNLNQYTQISNLCDSASLREEFIPQFDDDGNQTLIQTATGIWQVQYNGENRPIVWKCVSTNSPTHNSFTPPLITMSYDRLGRRVTKNDQRFIYNGYLCIGKIEDSTSIHYSLSPIHCFVWDPTEPVATRPLIWLRGTSAVYYTHDGNKNVSDVIVSNGEVAAHYDYAPFGAVSVHTGVLAAVNPFRFSSECVDDALRLVYYNFRHYEPVVGRWLRRDPIGENGGLNNYSFLHNDILRLSDYLGEYCSVCGYVDYSAWSMGVRAGSVFRDCRKEPSIWDQFGSNSNPFHQEMYFQTRYSQLLVVAKQSFSARIMQRIDCKSATVEIKAGEDMYEYHAGDTYFPFIPCSGGDVYEGQEPQGWYERYCGLGNFTLKIDKSVIVAYDGDCKDCKRKFRWYTTMYILDELGVSRNDRWPVSWLQPFAPARIVIRAKWTIDGEGECKCDKQ